MRKIGDDDIIEELLLLITKASAALMCLTAILFRIQQRAIRVQRRKELLHARKEKLGLRVIQGGHHPKELVARRERKRGGVTE